MLLQEFIKKFHGKDVDGADLVSEIWRLDLDVNKKIILSLELNDLKPSYSILMNMWLEYSFSNSSNKEWNELIYSYYLLALSDSDKDLTDTVEYSLYFDILEDPERNKEAWNYFLNSGPNERFLRIMLTNSGPVPYDIKHQLYEKLINSTAFHQDLYISICHSCFDNCGNIDKEQAYEILLKLDLNEQLKELNSQKGVRKYQEVVAFLRNEI